MLFIRDPFHFRKRLEPSFSRVHLCRYLQKLMRFGLHFSFDSMRLIRELYRKGISNFGRKNSLSVRLDENVLVLLFYFFEQAVAFAGDRRQNKVGRFILRVVDFFKDFALKIRA